ncbi:replication-associated recombination protein A [Helcococcus ovis]|uniref:Replication-associated recombination protein A n=1 Tax=Helcococcus ovis TaxID=72026 RepID=A0A4R9C1G0_9FIRM|nr:replication-associated recombination protein A [Helcococcus ovis]TFF64172.1 replication-associated recombination protein A [Helcococcus ovis]TFF66448.1 replication-associated recombination protein A [Helcococcus ovis]
MDDNLDFFDINKNEQLNTNRPMAARLRPNSIDDFIGQEHLIGKDKPLYRMIKADKLASMIFYGPPGTGKTTLAYIIAKSTKMDFVELSATSAGVKDIKNVIERAENNLSLYSIRTLLFIDEIHRFNKSQQDTLLPHVESGLITLIGATTENPYFEVNKALISRAHILTLERFKDNDLRKLINNAINDKKNGFGNLNIEITDEAIDYLIMTSSGDARQLLNNLEISVLSTDSIDGKIFLDLKVLQDTVIKKAAIYDKSADEHYDTISAFIKSMRGSDPDASLYYLAKMLVAGEDIKFIARRILIFAAEDIGVSDPNAINIANSTFQAINAVGMPEARIILSNAVIYMALSPKSNSAYLAIDKAIDFVKNGKHYNVPTHLRDSHYKDAHKLGRGEGYKYPHNYDLGYVNQTYLPQEIRDIIFYENKKIGYEKSINDRLNKIKERHNNGN